MIFTAEYNKSSETEIFKMIEIGMNAPDFTLPDSEGNERSLSDFRGKRVVLYFYSKDNTAGCTRQACAFAGAYSAFGEKGVEVIGISKDTPASHAKFRDKYNLPFTLLSDTSREVSKAYGVLKEKKMYGKVSIGVERTTFIISPDGKIEHILRKVNPDTNAADILKLI